MLGFLLTGGLALDLAAHAAALLGHPWPVGPVCWGLFGGYAVLLPLALLAAPDRPTDARRGGRPVGRWWGRWLTAGLAVYVFAQVLRRVLRLHLGWGEVPFPEQREVVVFTGLGLLCYWQVCWRAAAGSWGGSAQPNAEPGAAADGGA